ncbi:hypothetical protein CCR94_04915 [Rhodoblastus sphagnicola]|uniref:Uncharacterized protein n=1 Tax=Rhodoblastus sphagnicola TaxID=333368 RepID=A0A2S6ND34_9HYPH|nr:hypothetical protein [Rhodoblastus sphagnicola]MBB4198042.1 hypothetical protein [Rhodoblastus sphagnicola]PPQ32530.1 hypothetical protein CCR94_04915 [Rhodoblastus sphagnicola]
MQAFPPLGREFEPFLYAVLYEDGNGMPLTMVSAIARSGADPWGEAARIAHMPKTLALDALARLMPDRSGADAALIADRLFALLPSTRENRLASAVTANVMSANGLSARVLGAAKPTPRWSPLVPAILILLVAVMLMSVFRKTQHSDASQPERPAPPVADRADP